MTDMSFDAGRLLHRLQTLGQTGRRQDGALTRLAATDSDKAGRDQFVAWLREAGLGRCQVGAHGRAVAAYSG